MQHVRRVAAVGAACGDGGIPGPCCRTWRVGGHANATIPVVGTTVRERVEDLERSSLSGWATVSSQSKGRERPEAADPIRTAFQVDRDRILHSLAFRRLHDKTHCFIPARDAGAEPPYRTRLTHTLTVAQIARTIGRALRANEDLVEAIALGADLGATPFGHAGEEALAAMLEPPFRHDEQSLRVVEALEEGGRGLNLSWEVRDGILHHPWSMPPAATLEGQVVRLATRIALVTYDVDDALRAGLVSADDLPEDAVAVLGGTTGQRVSRLVGDLVDHGESTPTPAFSDDVEAAQSQLTRFLGQRIGATATVRGERDRALHVMSSLVVFLREVPDGLPRPPRGDEALEQRIVDHLSGLGDGAARRLFVRTFVPGATADR